MMHMMSELAQWLVRLREGEDLAGANMPGSIMAGANVVGARSQQACAASVHLPDGISVSGFLRV